MKGSSTMAADETKTKFDWVPQTPTKSVPARYELNSTGKRSSSDHYNQTLCCEFGPESTQASESTTVSNETNNEAPKTQGKRPKIKKHRGKVYDKTKHKKKPLNSSTPLPRTAKRKPQPRTANCKLTEPSIDIDQEEVGDSNDNICKRKLNFDIENRTMNQIFETRCAPDSVSGFSSPRDCTRIFRPNECLQNSRETGLVFPSLLKKARSNRSRATAFDKFVSLVSVAPTIQKQKRVASGTLKLNWVGRRKRGNKSIPKMDFPSLSSSVDFSDTFLWIASSIRAKIATKIAARVEVNMVSCNDHIQHSEEKKLIELCQVSCDDHIQHSEKKKSNELCNDHIQQHSEERKSTEFCNDHIPNSEEKKLIELSQVSCNDHIQPSEKKKSIEFCQDHLAIQNYQPSEKKKSIEFCQDHLAIQNYQADFEDHTYRVEMKLSGRTTNIDTLNSFEDEVDDEEDNVSTNQDDYDMYTKAMVDFSIQKMEGLDIGGLHNQLVLRNQNNSAIYYEGNFDPLEKYRAKVDIDAESIRIFKLPIGSDENNGDDDNAKYWANERKLYEGRLDNFIYGMNIIQGNKKFSQWKGSVVDSVVGVLLTQNVGDHLSSQAFMNLASIFPAASDSDRDFAIHDSKLLMIVGKFSDEVESENLSIVEKKDDLEGGNANSSQAEFTSGKRKEKGKNKDKEDTSHWDKLRLKYSTPKNKTDRNRDSVNWEAVRQSSFYFLSTVIQERGMRNLLTARIKDLLERLVKDHGSIDLEWLRDVPPQEAKEYLLSILGLGLKSVECVRLLSLHQQAFPVDVNIARVTTRLGWIPLQPLPDNVPMHLLDLYPALDGVQKYLWPRILNLPHAKLYEAHCHLILFGKSICAKKKPNCGACLFRPSCKHYASLCASARPGLEGPHESSEHVSSQGSVVDMSQLMLPGLDSHLSAGASSSRYCVPVIEMPESPRREYTEADVDAYSQTLRDIEDPDSEDEMPTYNLCYEKSEHCASKALVTVNEVATHTTPPLKTQKRLRTEHYVYELPDSHPLLAGFEKREPEDEYLYLLAIWMPKKADVSQESTEVVKYQDERIVQGTILIPCRTANRGNFPLNGTYFQVNEVFADHESSHHPIDVPREWVWNLKRRLLYCATSVSSVCREMSVDKISYFFKNGSLCVRAFDRRTRGPKPLEKRFHESATRVVHE